MRNPEWLSQAESDIEAMRCCAAAKRGDLMLRMSAERGTPATTIRTYMSIARNFRRARARDPHFAATIATAGVHVIKAAVAAHAANPAGARAIICEWQKGALRSGEVIRALKALPAPVGGQVPCFRDGPIRKEVEAANRKSAATAARNMALASRIEALEGAISQACAQFLDRKGRWRGATGLGPDAASAAVALGAVMRGVSLPDSIAA